MKPRSILALAAPLLLAQVCVAAPEDDLFRLSNLARELSDDPAARHLAEEFGAEPAPVARKPAARPASGPREF